MFRAFIWSFSMLHIKSTLKQLQHIKNLNPEATMCSIQRP